jgi:hypothetical protein
MMTFTYIYIYISNQYLSFSGGLFHKTSVGILALQYLIAIKPIERGHYYDQTK